MVTFDPDKSKVLEFKINISGNSSVPVARLIVPLGENLDISILGEIHDNSIQVTVPKLRPFYENLKSGTVKLEIIVDGNLFTPWVEHAEFKEQLMVVAEAVSEREVNNPKDNVQVNASLINESVISSLPKKRIGEKFKIKPENEYL